MHFHFILGDGLFLNFLVNDKVEMKNYKIRRRVYELISKAASSGPSLPLPGQRELHLVFFKPDRFLESDDRSGNVAGVRLEETTLRGKFPS